MDNNIIPLFSFGIATFVVGFIMIPFFIDLLIKFKMGKQIRSEATIGKATEFEKLHKKKKGTPTMGGFIIIFIVFLMVIASIILQELGFIRNSLLNQRETYLSLFTLLSVGGLGLIDDYLNIKGVGKTKGLSARVKMFGLILFATLGAFWFYYKLGWNVVDGMGNYVRTLNNPFGDNISIGLYFIPLFIFIIIATSNSVNLTDGLDGLAGGLLLFSYSVYAYITYDQGLFLLSTLCISIIGALAAFLWFNVKPAKFYMGDVGSLALGANLGIMAMITNTVFILIIIGAIFILETLSVIIQLISKKFRNGKKIFRIAPYHHHLEAIGWSEENVVFRLWLIGMLFSVIGIIFYIIQG
ncbi:phospho-N-acetylmuramoyl-pentapeptide-transferase [Candidatus Gracilibacteria bacterium 28_42_T64]|nr:phospho-N-acetylmuramoyl-pentapeptide-transferase [Candidatus Gracilibacteria bacterium 28_42_T64]